ncbi:glycosyltransferase family 2 protein [Fusobacterium sp. PH5-44]|uniref:glycosyltransferase family 2 protein n=1 Tax=unclassified Fusobacterium TaxID=2648384 RepID=UPI003D1A05E5
MMPLVSIVMPVYNAEKYLTKSIESVIMQTYSNWELLLIDDCSQDDSSKLMKSFQEKDARIKGIKNSVNKGAAYSRNIGIENSTGCYIAFLDSDDIWNKDKLENQIKFMIKNDVLMCHSDYNFIDENGLYIKKINTDKELCYKKLLKENQIRTSFLVIKKEIVGDIKFPDVKHEDFAFFLDLLSTNKIKSVRNNCIGGAYRVMSHSLSSNKIKSAIWTWKIYKDYLKLNYFSSMYYFSFYVIRCIKKYKK